MQFFVEAKYLWGRVDIRSTILLSLSLQVLLMIYAPFRKSHSNRCTDTLTWIAYLTADWVANYAFGIISKAQINGFTPGYDDDKDAYGRLLAFWAPFLLLHLGGPDCITAFSLEDNELWRRHLLNLLFQLGTAGFVFYQSFPNNMLMVPTILIFIGGTIKYIERACAVYLASFSKFHGGGLTSLDAWPNYAKIKAKTLCENKANVPASIETAEPPVGSTYHGVEDVEMLDDREVIEAAFLHFTTFKGLLVDFFFNFHDRNECRKFFSRRTAKDAFRVIEAELNFFYDILYTKTAVVHCPTGYLFRAISVGSIITAFTLFHFLEKGAFHKYDVWITYTLLIGGVGLEFLGLVRLICSDWTIALLGRSEKRRRCLSIGSTFIEFLLKFKSETSPFASHVLNARWSKSIGQCNFIESRLRKRPKWIGKLIDARLRKWPKWIEKLLGLIPLTELFDDLKSGQVEVYGDKLGELIFNEVRRKSLDEDNWDSIKTRCASQGKWSLTKHDAARDLLQFLSPDYRESLLLWHIATELCYNIDESGYPRRQTSKVLSDYMLYLMIKQPGMMAGAAGFGQKMIRDTCAEMDAFFTEIDLVESKPNIMKNTACARLLSDLGEADMNGVTRKYALVKACHLAKQLLRIEKESMWVIVSEVWVELLEYAAIHCRPHMHAQQLHKGGELITLVWLLMVHVGLSEQFLPIDDPEKN